MNATPQQIEKAYQLHVEGARLRRVMKETGLDNGTVKTLTQAFREYERQRFSSQDRAKKMDRLLSFAHPPHEIERGRSKGGYVNTPTCDRAPVPSGMGLTPFLDILTDQPIHTSMTLPPADWITDL